MSDPRAAALEARLDALAPGLASVGPAADPYSTAALTPPAGAGGGYVFGGGDVVDAVPGAHLYRVMTGPGGTLWATPAGETAFEPSGVRPSQTIRLGAHVLYARPAGDADYALILAVVPRPSVHRAGLPAEGAWPFFRSGHGVDPAHSEPIAMGREAAARAPNPPPGVDLWDLSAGRHLDATTAGEWSRLSELGVGLFADPWHAGLRADETTGVYAFYLNQLLRVAGYNREDWSVLEEREQKDDEGELYGVTRRSVYPWESYGLWYPNQATPSALWQAALAVEPAHAQAGSGQAVWEPQSVTQTAAARLYAYDGYLGQGGKTLLALPRLPQSSAEAAALAAEVGVAADDTVELAGGSYAGPVGRLDNQELPVGGGRLDNAQDRAPTTVPAADRQIDTVQVGVQEEFRALTGAYGVRSAKRVVLAKRPSMPVPWQRRLPADPGGDTPDDYAPSGWFGVAEAGAGHAVYDDLEYAGGGPQRAQAVPDLLAYFFNWEGLAAFAYHAKDWTLLDEGQQDPHGPDSLPRNQVAPAYARLAAAQYLDDPTPARYWVDHRYGYADYYETESVIALLDDGQVYVQDGAGTTIKLLNGHATIECAGDLDLRAGRNINLRAGHDVTVTARDSLDLVAERHDGRLVAGRNLELLGGAGGCGGVLVESQAACPAFDFAAPGEAATTSGVTLLAPRSAVTLVTPDLVAQSPTADGRVVLDMGTRGVVRAKAQLHECVVHPDGARCDFFSDGAAACVAANEFTAQYALLGAALSVSGPVLGTGAVTTGVGVTQAAADAAPLRNIPDRVGVLTAVAGRDALAAAVLPPHAEAAEVTLRTDADYRTAAGYALREARWQTLARLAGQDLPGWSGLEVFGRVSAEGNYAFPGQAWVDTAAFVRQPPTLVDPANGWVAVPRTTSPGVVSADYTDPVLAAEEAVAPAVGYLVITQPD